jgi:hypothetical protein
MQLRLASACAQADILSLVVWLHDQERCVQGLGVLGPSHCWSCVLIGRLMQNLVATANVPLLPALLHSGKATTTQQSQLNIAPPQKRCLTNMPGHFSDSSGARLPHAYQCLPVQPQSNE